MKKFFNRVYCELLSIRSLLVLIGATCSFEPLYANVILHAFNWKYAEITAKAGEIASIGYKMVLIAPPLKSKGSAWWQLYQPQDYRVVDSNAGNLQDLKRMIAALKSQGVEVCADVLLNDMANEYLIRQDLNYPGAQVLADYASHTNYFAENRLFGDLRNNLFSAQDFHPAFCIKDYKNVSEVQNGRICNDSNPQDPGLPDFNDGSWVIEQQRNYLAALKELGINGFRIDAAKHITLSHLGGVFIPEIRDGSFLFGEVITYGGSQTTEYQKFLQPFLQSTDYSAYDFPLLATMVRAMAYNGSLKELIAPYASGSALHPGRAVTMAVTHDIANGGALFASMLMDPIDEWLSHVYLLGRDGGVPMIYSDHDEAGLHRWRSYYNQPVVRKLVAFHNFAQGQQQQILDSSNCHMVWQRVERGIVAINKCTQPIDITVSAAQLAQLGRSFTELFTSQQITVTGNSFKFTIPARRAVIWINSEEMVNL